VAQSSGTPGTNIIYMRGVAPGGDGNHSGPLPSVGVYLDEQPVTTIGGNLDVHVYDIARIESLAGPRARLWRFVGSRHDPHHHQQARYHAMKRAWTWSEPGPQGRHRRQGGRDGQHPAVAKAALRVVGYYEDAGYIDNVPGTRSFPAAAWRHHHQQQPVRQEELQRTPRFPVVAPCSRSIWTTTGPSRPGSCIRIPAATAIGYDSSVGDLQVQHFLPEYRRDIFAQASLTIEGKIGSWDLTYAGAYLDRKTFSSSDYTDYAEAYDLLYSGAAAWLATSITRTMPVTRSSRSSR
jgi:hypothetical protein